MLILTRPWRPALLLALLLATGCGGRGSVTGKVTFKSQPMPGGSVVFRNEATGAGGSGEIDPKTGQYRVDNLPPGATKVSVQPFGVGMVSSGPRGQGGPPKDKSGPPKDVKLPEGADPKMFDRTSSGAKAVKLNPKYLDDTKSGLSLTVQSGSNTYDIAAD